MDDVVEHYAVQLVVHVEAAENDAAAVCQAPDVLVKRRVGQVCKSGGLPAVDSFGEKAETRVRSGYVRYFFLHIERYFVPAVFPRLVGSF